MIVNGPPYARELEVALSAVRTASRLALLALPRVGQTAVSKADESPVTTADFAIQALLTATLHDAFREDEFVGEESSGHLDEGLLARVSQLLDETKSASRLDKFSITKFPEGAEKICEMIDLGGHGRGVVGGAQQRRIWVFDPIDGTKAFMRQEIFTIHVSLLDSTGNVVLTVIGCPNLDTKVLGYGQRVVDTSVGSGCIVWAIKGHGMFLQDLDFLTEKPVRRIQPHASVVRNPSNLRWVDCHTNAPKTFLLDIHRRIVEMLNNGDSSNYPHCDTYSTIMRYVLLGLGNTNAFMRIYHRWDYRSCIWDHSPAMLFEEMGGKVTDLDGNPLSFACGRKMADSFCIIAAPVAVHDQVLKAVREGLKEANREDLLQP